MMELLVYWPLTFTAGRNVGIVNPATAVARRAER